MEKIVAAAVNIDGLIISMKAPCRHGDVLENLYFFFAVAKNVEKQMVQGFTTSTGRFVDRREAFIIAKESGQLPQDDDGECLISEDLW